MQQFSMTLDGVDLGTIELIDPCRNALPATPLVVVLMKFGQDKDSLILASEAAPLVFWNAEFLSPEGEEYMLEVQVLLDKPLVDGNKFLKGRRKHMISQMHTLREKKR